MMRKMMLMMLMMLKMLMMMKMLMMLMMMLMVMVRMDGHNVDSMSKPKMLMKNLAKHIFSPGREPFLQRVLH